MPFLDFIFNRTTPTTTVNDQQNVLMNQNVQTQNLQAQQQAVTAQIQQFATANQMAFGRIGDFATLQETRAQYGYFTAPQHTPQQLQRRRTETPVEGILDMASVFMNSGLEFTELVVPKETFYNICHDLRAMTQYRNVPQHEAFPPMIIINTCMGPVRISHEAKPNFNLDKYMETIE